MSVHLGTRVRGPLEAAILADLAMRGLAISFLTLARVASKSRFLSGLCRMHDRDTGGGPMQSLLAQLGK